MFSFFETIFNTLKSVITFFIHTIQSLMNLLYNIPRYIAYLSNAILNVPTVFIPFLAASIYIYVMYLITDRNINN